MTACVVDRGAVMRLVCIYKGSNDNEARCAVRVVDPPKGKPGGMAVKLPVRVPA